MIRHHLAGSASRRGILAVRAESDVPTMIRGVQNAFTEFKSSYDQKHDAIVADLDRLNIMAAAGNIGPGLKKAADPEYTGNFNAWLRAGEREVEIRAANKTGDLARINASMSVGTPADGGFLAPIEWDRQIRSALLPVSPMRRLASVVETGVNGFSTLWDSQGWGSGWVGETAARPQTTSTTLASLTFATGEIYANPAVTQRLLDDAQINVDTYLTEQIGEEFGRQESIAFISGNGTNKPNGLLTYATGGTNAATHPGGALDTVTVAGTTAVTADELVGFYYGLAAPYRQNSSWLMSSPTALMISKLKDSAGDYIWRESLSAGTPATLLGRPVEYDENMPAPTTGALPIALGDFRRGYLINDRTGVRVLRDPYTNKPYVMFYATKRVGGGVLDPRSVRILKMA